ncbi:MAG: YiiD C-terminal domain-containing protein [Pseudomonadota bacterium]
MNAFELERYLFDRVPIAQSLGVKLTEVDLNHVSTLTPIEPNKNHLNTVFGGSSSMVCILTAWSLFQNRALSNNLDGQIMIRRQTVNYFKPITSDFVCNACFNEDLDWNAFLNTFNKMNKARLGITARIYQGEQLAVEFVGEFVLLKT